MAEAIETASTNQPAPGAAESKPTPTLEDVYKEFIPPRSAEPAPQPHPQPAPQPAPSFDVPDPTMEPEKFKAFMGDRAKAESALLNSFNQLSGMYSQLQRDRAMEVLRKDIDSAVDTVNGNLAEPLDGPQKKMIEYALEDKARSDPRFKQIWDNRGNNPIAWQRALSAVSGEFAATFDRKHDPQLRADRQALRISQSTSATTKTETDDTPAWQKAPADSPEFQAEWQKAARGYQ